MKTIMVCIKRRYAPNPSCAARGSEALAARLEAEIAARGLPLRVHRFPCLGMCEDGPNMKIVGGELFHHVGEAELPAVLAAALDDD
ncbi:(2Fe-2S) ferredoxin domain-containing protein [Chitinimonas koreensis]|uniref:(2Fe-2S) ferredoxin domain-containing protein n=1 Tax=Chitinimonas koreensis TaxID=356302 RepID=UPI0006870DC4|nr:(2Fe-2S) ferredoxin domain-containing protein [Chitinimonas koreensis]QNM94793.1 (2Fe-2S) ferredoxin domain-containing protein [Chitinimonas koreensis]